MNFTRKTSTNTTYTEGSSTPPTDELVNEIKKASNIEDYLGKNNKYLITHSLSEHLNMLLSQKGISRADVVRDSMLDKSYVYQIFSGDKTPSRDKLIAVAFGLKLSDDETQQMLKLSGNRELYAKDKRDAVILFSLHHQKTIFETNDLLFQHELTLLGLPKE